MTYDPTKGNITLVELQNGEIATSDVTVTGSWFQGAIINHLLRSASTTGSLCYLSLYYSRSTVEPPQSNVPFGGEGGIIPAIFPYEVSGSGYARKFVTGSFTVTNASAVNTNSIFFDIATSDWGDITHFALTNGSQTGGNSGCMLFYGPLSASRTISTGDIFVILPEELKIQMSGGIPYASGSRILNHYLNNIVYPAPAGSSITCALYSVPPEANGTGGTELTGIGYARKQAGGSGSWVDPFNPPPENPPVLIGGGYSQGANIITGKLFTTNACSILFSTGVVSDWGAIKYFTLWDSLTNKLIYRGTVDPVVTVLAPDGFMFDVGGITIFPDTGRSAVE